MKKNSVRLKDGHVDTRSLKIAVLQRGYDTIRDFAPATGVSYATLINKFKCDNQWTISDIQRVSNVLQLTDEEFIKIFYCKTQEA